MRVIEQIKLNFFKQLRWPFLVLFLFGVITYANALGGGFAFDDQRHLLDAGRNLNSASYFQLLTEAWHGFYRPASFVFLKTALHFFGTIPLLYVIYNFILFYFVCCLIFLFVRRLSENNVLAFLSSCFYIVHPINAMAVNYKTAGNNTLTVIYTLLSFLFFIKSEKEKSSQYYWISVFFCLLAIFSHSMAVLLPFYLLLIMITFSNKTIKQKIVLIVPFLVSIALYFFVRSRLPGNVPLSVLAMFGAGFHENVATLGQAIIWYIRKLFYPNHILFVQDFPIVQNYSIIWNYIFIFGVLGIFGVFSFLSKEIKRKFFWFIFFIVGFAPILSAALTYTMYTRTAILEPHWFGISSIGFFVLLAKVVLWSVKRLKDKWKNIVVVGCLVFYMFLSVQYNIFWKTEAMYCDYWINIHPYNRIPWRDKTHRYLRNNDQGFNVAAYQNLNQICKIAGAYQIVGDYKTAISYYSMAYNEDQNNPEVLLGIGLFRVEQHNWQEAKQFLERAVLLKPEYAVYVNDVQMYFDGKTPRGYCFEIYKIISTVFQDGLYL